MRRWFNSIMGSLQNRRGGTKTALHLKILENREEWLRNRTRIGGSEASAIVGLNPFMSNTELWDIKAGLKEHEDISDKPVVAYGNAAEPLQREMFKLDYPQYKVWYQENNMFTNDRFPFAHASLDGALSDEKGRSGILEIKTTNIIRKEMADKWKERLPDNYYIQLLHYLMVTEFDFAILRAQLRWERDGEVYCQIRHYQIERCDVEEDIQFLIQKEKEFWESIQNGIRPPRILPNI